jgi:hypothetical protein
VQNDKDNGMRISSYARWLLPLSGLLLTTPAALAGTVVQYNKDYVEDAIRAPEFAIDDKMAVLGAVLAGLPDKVTVYPTEGYFYFSFHHKGIKYGGNLRFDIADRDKGVLHFNYFKDFTLWQRDESGFSAELGKKEGVNLTKAGNLLYDLEYKGKKVQFQLVDLSKVKPPADAVQPGETYIGPIFDESAIRFFLIFNESQKTFHYILDETIPVADQFDMSEVSDRITIGIRTGYAFYDDRFAKRKILIGISQYNTSINNYLDGPFDQLPDNFIVGDTLKNAILAASPDRVGQIDRFGNSPDGETRYLIAPYMQYEEQSELGTIADCAATEQQPVYYSCFSFAEAPGDDQAEDPDADPNAAADPNAEDGDKPADDKADTVKDPAAKPAK